MWLQATELWVITIELIVTVMSNCIFVLVAFIVSQPVVDRPASIVARMPDSIHRGNDPDLLAVSHQGVHSAARYGRLRASRVSSCKRSRSLPTATPVAATGAG